MPTDRDTDTTIWTDRGEQIRRLAVLTTTDLEVPPNYEPDKFSADEPITLYVEAKLTRRARFWIWKATIKARLKVAWWKITKQI